MKCLLSALALTALALLSPNGIAQQRDSIAENNEGDLVRAPAAALSRAAGDTQPGFRRLADSNLFLEQTAKSSPQKPKGPKIKPSGIEKPPIEGSMVGYVDNAIIESQIRIRFDAAFDDNSPDRAEFFYAKCGCYRALAGTPFAQAFDPNAPGPGTGIPTALNYQQLRFNGEYAPFRRLSFFVDVPIRWLQPQGFVPAASLPFTPSNFGDQSGISDVEAGFKAAAIANRRTYLTFQLRTYFPSGDSFRGLGTAHYSVEPAVLLYQKLSDRVALEGQLSDWHPINGSRGVPVMSSQGFAGDVFTYGFGLSYRFQASERISVAPVVEMVGWNVISGFQSLQPGFTDASGTNIVNIKGGLRTTFDHHNSFYIGFGQAVTHDLWYKHLLRVEYRYRF
jgi:hypothetical protein